MADIDYRDPTILQVDDAQVTVTNSVTYVDLTAGAGGELLAENNLSDLDSAADARTNLGATILGEDLFTAPDAATVWTALGLGNYANDAAAAAGGVAVGAAYHTAGVLKTRLV